jgi:hypothetical protein
MFFTFIFLASVDSPEPQNSRSQQPISFFISRMTNEGGWHMMHDDAYMPCRDM